MLSMEIKNHQSKTKKLVCKRGHDTSFPEARLSDRSCRLCKNITNAKYARSLAGKANKIKRQKKYRATFKGRYYSYKQDLRKRIKRKKIKLERIMHEAEEFYGIRA